MDYRSNGILAFIPHNQSEKVILNQALFFQQNLNMRVFILRILKRKSIFSIRTKEKTEQIKTVATEKLTNIIEETLQKEIPNNIITRIKTGDVLSTLLNESKSGGYNFIVLDKKESNLKINDINKLLSRSHCPVLLTNKDFPVTKIEKIVIPIEIAQTTQKRLLWATFFARQFQAKIEIISALNIDIKETKSLAFSNADKIRTMLLSRNVDCDIKMLKVHDQSKHKVILSYIEEENPDLVLIRTHQDSFFSDSRIGQFVSEIIHGCKMPVFVVGYANKPVLFEIT